MPTLEIEPEIAQQLGPYQSDVNAILQLGIREWQARDEPGFAGLHDILEKLATLPDPHEILKLRASPSLQERIEDLLEKNRTTGFTDEERREWDHIEYVEHLVTMAKLNATLKLKRAAG
jgi:hypothetical protein